ncbi:ribonuclease T2 [Choloepus didactylus]|uniref:ribonuclease T2 n=1 Tax=Choloepus didactylus TaxID=27675 RepID=UPI00189C9B9A|nr:ribonuclease T2 [Choloepus didactylus]XP_037673585.1 ribonuclease T2 [Choloepus didactylus]XP_037673586.1 ribonuclease T2 [Choloepus didactylus]XP_037673588.1 ribonuclease T2 [Choloepus didactylus]XP_037673589.1 ribonuclease T2 [Choloepus didactylus]XP_037673590.1 ribonuclease T2 [Choloepus didactylus]
MKPRVINNLLCSFCLAFYCLCHADKFLKSGNHEWKKLIMVHHWPATVCKEIENDCTQPPDYWTIHGLWPDKAEDCNGSWHFNLDEIKDLLPDMKKYWPDVIHPNRSHFWKHEWEKHGTCAAELDTLNSEEKYFGTSLDLFKKLTLSGVLQKLGIKPSLNYYLISDIKDALTGIYGVVPKIQCLPPKQDEEVQTIAQIELCLTRELQLRNCSEPEELRPHGQGDLLAGVGPVLSVCEDGPAFYPPTPKEQAWMSKSRNYSVF